MVSLARLTTAFDDRNAAGEGEHNVLPKIFQFLRLPAAETLAQADQQQQRSDATGYTKHGKKRTKFVGPERGQRLPNDFDQQPHSLVESRLPVWGGAACILRSVM